MEGFGADGLSTTSLVCNRLTSSIRKKLDTTGLTASISMNRTSMGCIAGKEMGSVVCFESLRLT